VLIARPSLHRLQFIGVNLKRAGVQPLNQSAGADSDSANDAGTVAAGINDAEELNGVGRGEEVAGIFGEAIKVLFHVLNHTALPYEVKNYFRLFLGLRNGASETGI